MRTLVYRLDGGKILPAKLENGITLKDGVEFSLFASHSPEDVDGLTVSVIVGRGKVMDEFSIDNRFNPRRAVARMLVDLESFLAVKLDGMDIESAIDEVFMQAIAETCQLEIVFGEADRICDDSPTEIGHIHFETEEIDFNLTFIEGNGFKRCETVSVDTETAAKYFDFDWKALEKIHPDE